MSQTFTILFVCTGNVCRSPLAERLALAYLDERLGEVDGPSVRVGSAGVGAVVGSAMHPNSAVVLRGLGGDPTGFVARRFTPELAATADLVLTMTRAQRHAVLEAAPRALRRTFTLLEAADLLEMLEGIEPHEGDIVGRAQRMVRAMSDVRSHRRTAMADDVPDPIGLPLEAHWRMGHLVRRGVTSVLDRLAMHTDTLLSDDS